MEGERTRGARGERCSLPTGSRGHNRRYILGMSAATERAFRKSLQSRALERAYYLYGDDDFLKEDAVRQLIATAVEPATRDFNLDIRDGVSLDGESLSSLLATPPMMAERRVVVVRNAPALRKDVRAALDRYLTAPAADVVLVLVAPAGDKGGPDKAIAQMLTTVEFEPLTGDRVGKWIAHHASSVLGVEISADAVELLHRAVGNDLPALASELDKLASFSGGAEITETAVAAVVGVRRGETLGDLLDRVTARDAAGALAILPHVLEQPKISPVSVVMALTVHLLAIAWGTAVPGRADYFSLLKSARNVYPGRSWTDAAAAWQRAAGSWSAAALDDALEALLDADLALKETRVSSDEQLLATLVLSLCAAEPRMVAASA
jgi:DNA polymerase-3 subunit delta